ncbi:DUF4055 domain-containing protein [Pseudanabaena sp. FACHB-2040]|uniref:DUF4055 domain-containing protein n=1 Tax=Pseudanabaena sp. FACHB-2040 TaxID=2692859 RepID=UPI001688DA4A|nr:DUF4055 domain-containing protein [Pseudanabaena sp. FACHB-2040]MBD2261357.1 DUF4055 domain-containing protein [Pseudanabaena sp. FACHB-2040]
MTYDRSAERLKATPINDGQSPFPDKVKAAAEDNKPGPRTPGAKYREMERFWQKLRDVRGGTEAMRDAGKSYLPEEPDEAPETYANRLGRATLAPIYEWLVGVFVGMIMRKPIALPTEGIPSDVQAHLANIDLEGSSLDQFASDLLESAIDYSYCGVLVEYPTAEGIATRADEVAAALRPYWVAYPGDRILDMRWHQQGSQHYLKQLRLLQHLCEPDGDFGERSVEQVMVYDRTPAGVTWRTFRESKEKKWVEHQQGTLSRAEIPFEVLWTNRKQKITKPPMIEALNLNIRHYQLSADLDYSLHIASVPRWLFFGTTAEDLGSVGSVSEAICFPNENARAEWSIPDISAFEPVRDRMGEVERQAKAMGLAAMVAQKNVGESAEAKRLDRGQGDSRLAVLAQTLQQVIDRCLGHHYGYMGLTPAQAPACQVNRDFDTTTLDAGMLGALTGAANAGKLSDLTYHGLLKAGEIGLPDDWTPELEAERLEQQRARDTARPLLANGLKNPLDSLLEG